MPHFNTHNLRASGRWVSPPSSAPLGLSRHMAGQRARALSWLTRHSALHRRAQRLLLGSAIVTTLNRPGLANCFAHHMLPLWRALCSSSSSPGRSTPPSRRTIPCSSYIMAIRSLGRFVAPRPHMARPPPADSARGRRRGRIHAFLCHIGQVTSGQSWPVPYGASVPGHTRTTRTQGQGAASGSAGREE